MRNYQRLTRRTTGATSGSRPRWAGRCIQKGLQELPILRFLMEALLFHRRRTSTIQGQLADGLQILNGWGNCRRDNVVIRSRASVGRHDEPRRWRGCKGEHEERRPLRGRSRGAPACALGVAGTDGTSLLRSTDPGLATAESRKGVDEIARRLGGDPNLYFFGPATTSQLGVPPGLSSREWTRCIVKRGRQNGCSWRSARTSVR
jgi:hypothetical protein